METDYQTKGGNKTHRNYLYTCMSIPFRYWVDIHVGSYFFIDPIFHKIGVFSDFFGVKMLDISPKHHFTSLSGIINRRIAIMLKVINASSFLICGAPLQLTAVILSH